MPGVLVSLCFGLNICLTLFSFLFFFSVVEIKSDATLAEAVKILSQHNILSAPVVDVEASEDATWMDRYIGIVEFAGIAVWILQQVYVLIFVCMILAY